MIISVSTLQINVQQSVNMKSNFKADFYQITLDFILKYLVSDFKTPVLHDWLTRRKRNHTIRLKLPTFFPIIKSKKDGGWIEQHRSQQVILWKLWYKSSIKESQIVLKVSAWHTFMYILKILGPQRMFSEADAELWDNLWLLNSLKNTYIQCSNSW